MSVSSRALIVFAVGLSGCLAVPSGGAERALYVDLRKIVETNEDAGWIVDQNRLLANLEPALHSLCQVQASARTRLDGWLGSQLELTGGSAESIYRAHAKQLGPAREALSLERTRALLRYAQTRADAECPFWLEPNPHFNGQQSDVGRWLVLAETTAFASLVLQRWIPALGGGGRLLVGHGIGTSWTWAAGAELAASGAFVPTGGQGFDATANVALPLLLRFTRLSRVLDLELAPVVRFSSESPSWPPGARVQLAAGISGLRGPAFMSTTLLYLGYEFHPAIGRVAADHTLQLGTRLALEWTP
jgi:hypothetical protein